jgi:hypothetical protein
MRIVPKDWREFQHYKDRSPPWIRLHKKLLDNYEFHCLPVASRALAPMLWLLASDSIDGCIEASPEKLAFRLRQTEKEVTAALKPLIDNGFFIVEQPDSTLLADRKQVAVPETETEASQRHAASGRKGELFDAFWQAYPKKTAKDDARKAFEKRKPDADMLGQMLAALAVQKTSPAWTKDAGQFIPNPATWLNGGRWQDESESRAATGSELFAGAI